MYRLKPDKPVAREVRRIAAKQLRLAIAGTRYDRRFPNGAKIHEARRHIRKVRALVRLVQPALNGAYRSIDRQLMAAIRLLAPIADGEAMMATAARLAASSRPGIPATALLSLGDALGRRQARIRDAAALGLVLTAVRRILRAELEQVPRWRLYNGGFAAVAPGLEKTIRRARRGMAKAAEAPSNAAFYAWRHRVKEHWFQVRLLQGRTADALFLVEGQLEALDGLLGQYHDYSLLDEVMASEAGAPEEETAALRRLIRRRQTMLRRKALALGAKVYRLKARRTVEDLKRQWRSVGRSTAQPRAALRRAA